MRRITVQRQPGQIVLETLSRKYLTQKRAGGVAQVVDYLPSKCETPNSNPSTARERERDTREPPHSFHQARTQQEDISVNQKVDLAGHQCFSCPVYSTAFQVTHC
jgi:hypothetical protein